MSCFNIADIYHVSGIKHFHLILPIAPEIHSNISVKE